MTKHEQSGRTLAERPIHDGKVIRVVQEDVEFPDGSVGALDIVKHPGASAIVPFLGDPAGEDPQLLMIRQYRHAAGGWLFEIPAGRLDAGESPEACARRELLEETGCTAGTLEPLTTILTTPGFSDERIHLFMAAQLTRGASRREADEFIEPVVLPLSDALAKICSGEISDGKSIIGILYAAGFRLGA
jgi:ADP-ribose pyrophosphatase